MSPTIAPMSAEHIAFERLSVVSVPDVILRPAKSEPLDGVNGYTVHDRYTDDEFGTVVQSAFTRRWLWGTDEFGEDYGDFDTAEDAALDLIRYVRENA